MRGALTEESMGGNCIRKILNGLLALYFECQSVLAEFDFAV